MVDPGGPSQGPRVRLLIRQGCHLCDEALVVVEDVCRSRKVAYDVVDVDSDLQLKSQFTDHVPVTIVDDVVVSRWFLSTDDLVRALSNV